MQRLDRHGEGVDAGRVRDAQAIGAHVLDMRRPRIDEGNILARPRHMRAAITADRAGADDDDALCHDRNSLIQPL